MGLFGFVSELTSAAVKVAISPVAMIKDVADTAMGEEAENTKKLIESAGNDIEKGFEKLTGLD